MRTNARTLCCAPFAKAVVSGHCRQRCCHVMRLHQHKRANEQIRRVKLLSIYQGYKGSNAGENKCERDAEGRASKSSRIEVEMEDEAWIRDNPSFRTKWTKRRQSMWGQDEAKIQGGRRVRRPQPRREGRWETLHTGGRGLGHEKRGESRLSVGPGEVLDEVCIDISAVNLR